MVDFTVNEKIPVDKTFKALNFHQTVSHSSVAIAMIGQMKECLAPLISLL